MPTLVSLPYGVDAFDPSTWAKPVRNRATEKFSPYSNSDHSGCHGCNSDLLLSSPLLVDPRRQFTLTPALYLSDDGLVEYPWAWNVYYWRAHHVRPDNWGLIQTVAVAHLERLGRRIDNVTENLRGDGGLQSEHPHLWLIERRDSSRTGFAGTLLAMNRSR